MTTVVIGWKWLMENIINRKHIRCNFGDGCEGCFGHFIQDSSPGKNEAHYETLIRMASVVFLNQVLVETSLAL